MAKLPGSEAMLRGLTQFDARRRWSVRTALGSELFVPYRCAPGDAAGAAALRFDDYLDDA